MNVKAQVPNFFVDGSVWSYYTQESYEPNMCTTQNTLENDSIQGDTVINSISYKKLFALSQVSIQTYYPCYNGTTYPVGTTLKFIRYDTVTRKLFMKNDTGTYVPEILLYNFNLIAGDTIPLIPGYNSGFSGCRIIDSVKSIIFFGIPVRKFYMPYMPSNHQGNYIIEGMGGSNGLTFFQPQMILSSGGYYLTSLNCFKSGNNVYPNGASCPSFIPVGIQELQNKTTLELSPNPNNGSFTITSNNPQLKTIHIYNVLGEEVFHSEINNTKSEIITNNLPTGIYFVKVSSEKEVLTKMMVKE